MSKRQLTSPKLSDRNRKMQRMSNSKIKSRNKNSKMFKAKIFKRKSQANPKQNKLKVSLRNKFNKQKKSQIKKQM